MKSVPFPLVVEVSLLFLLLLHVHFCVAINVISVRHQASGPDSQSHGGNETVHHHHRVKRQLVAYHRLEAGGVLPVLANRRRSGKRRSPVGEDGSDVRIFRSAGVGYEHKHNNRCEESKCGYNIRHCPHGCVFNSFQCGGGAAYDTCCC